MTRPHLTDDQKKEIAELTAMGRTLRGLQTFLIALGFYHWMFGRGFGAFVICLLCAAYVEGHLPARPEWLVKLLSRDGPK